MVINKVEVNNFGSYKRLEFDFSSTGLALIYGPTGSGKSTAMEAVFWVLYGETLRGGNVDEVRSWTSGGKATTGFLELEASGTTLLVTRIRGTAGENDLFWTESERPDHQVRGKNLNETQVLLEKRIGISADLYRTGSTIGEFSPTGSFFTSKAKERRALFEKIAPLDLPIRLAERASEARKLTRKELAVSESNFSRLQGRYESTLSGLRSANASKCDWQQSQLLLVGSLLSRHKDFEKEKTSKIQALETRARRWEQAKEETVQKISEALSKITPSETSLEALDAEIERLRAHRCNECGGVSDKTLKALDKVQKSKQDLLNSLDRYNDLSSRLLDADAQENPYLGQLSEAQRADSPYLMQAESENTKVNPFDAQIAKLEKESSSVKNELSDAKDSCQLLETRVSNLTQIYDLSFILRGTLLNRAVKEIENQTNALLERYFDSELRVSFLMGDSDGLDVVILKSGYDATYRQLSRGQRCLLKLAFSVSVMEAAANHAGTHFNLICLDEPTDGLDVDLKIKAYALFEELASKHASVLVIEHDKYLQQLFYKKYRVTMDSDLSTIEEEDV